MIARAGLNIVDMDYDKFNCYTNPGFGVLTSTNGIDWTPFKFLTSLSPNVLEGASAYKDSDGSFVVGVSIPNYNPPRVEI